VLVDASGERLTHRHAVKKATLSLLRSTALITDARTDRAQGWRLPAQEIEDAVIRILADAMTSPAMLLEPLRHSRRTSDQTRKMLDVQPASPAASIAHRGTSQGRSRPHRESRDRGE